MVRSISLLGTVIMMTHWIACLFWLVTNAEGTPELAWHGYFQTNDLLGQSVSTVSTLLRVLFCAPQGLDSP